MKQKINWSILEKIVEKLLNLELLRPGSVTEHLFFISYYLRDLHKGTNIRINSINQWVYEQLPSEIREQIVQTYQVDITVGEQLTLAPPPKENDSILTLNQYTIEETIFKYDKLMLHQIDLIAGTFADLTPRRVNIYAQKLAEAEKLMLDTEDPVNDSNYPYLLSEVLGGRAESIQAAASAVITTAQQWMLIDSTLEGLHILWRTTIERRDSEENLMITMSNIAEIYNLILDAVKSVSTNLLTGDTPEDIITDTKAAIDAIL